MRKIEKEMLQAVVNKSNFAKDNTQVIYYPEINEQRHSRMETSKVFLHGNHIATVCHSEPHKGKVVVNKDTLTAYPTRTTTSRLRALGVHVNIKQGLPYINGELCQGN